MRSLRHTSDVKIRRAVVADAASIAAVLHESFIEYQPLYTPAGFAATTLDQEQVQQRMKEGLVWVALLNDAIVGTVAAVPKAEAFYIRGMAILPSARGRRIGELLLQEIERFAAKQGFQRLWLSTTPFLHRAIRLYEQDGFKRSSDGPQDLFGTPLFTMEKICCCKYFVRSGETQ